MCLIVHSVLSVLLQPFENASYTSLFSALPIKGHFGSFLTSYNICCGFE